MSSFFYLFQQADGVEGGRGGIFKFRSPVLNVSVHIIPIDLHQVLKTEGPFLFVDDRKGFILSFIIIFYLTTIDHKKLNLVSFSFRRLTTSCKVFTRKDFSK
jgi:hypothetical protein